MKPARRWLFLTVRTRQTEVKHAVLARSIPLREWGMGVRFGPVAARRLPDSALWLPGGWLPDSALWLLGGWLPDSALWLLGGWLPVSTPVVARRLVARFGPVAARRAGQTRSCCKDRPSLDRPEATRRSASRHRRPGQRLATSVGSPEKRARVK